MKNHLSPYLSSDERSVFRTVHVGIEGHLEVLWKNNEENQSRHSD